ncbi:ABC-type cobalt transport system ATPase component [Rubrobacter radiotolerans]|uniref:ABC-type cobalt transport system ATPase component n=1 Tax=Rubrobacter radiotolerans TaxID=42256 RepID=A0A023X5B9_RUBRA|nr:ABC-type cobalt transport system ATPase component [Rubrobacter radiotolerans]SMC06346.1 energy-coupling factor transport system ATP-binding protein [Rubrobacter radiotolerans DSM 5868]
MWAVRITVEDLCHVYSPGTDFEKVALSGVSLTVEPEEVLAVVGGTGSGKSTLVQHLNGLLAPTGGRVLVDGTDARELKKSDLRRRVGLVFQFPEAALFAPTVREDVSFAPRQLGLDAREVERRTEAALGRLGVGHLAERSPFALSGGERRRVAIAGILAMGPEVVVLDEPTAGLDPLAREGLLDLVRDLRDSGVSVVLVSHDLDEVAEVSDRVCVMEDGRVRALGSPGEVFYGRAGVDAPETVRVASLVAELVGEERVGRPVRFEETVRALRRVMEKEPEGGA